MAKKKKVQVEQTGVPEGAVGVRGPVGEAEIRKAQQVLQEYREGKKAFNDRIINNENWYRLHNQGSNDALGLNNLPDSAWMFNSLANKHADAMDNYPEPNILPRAQDDERTAKQLSAILPVVLEQNEYEQVYNDAWWYKIKHGAACKMVVWDGQKQNGLGDIGIRMVDLLNLYWEPGVTDLQASRNLFHLEMVDNDVLCERYPWAAEHTGGEQLPKYLYDDQVRTDNKSVVVDWYYKKAGKLHYCKFVNDAVLYASENDPAYAERGFYDHGKYPFVMDVMFPMAGSPAGFGYIELMKGAQYSIDVLGASITRNADAASRVRYFVNGGSGLNEEEFADMDKAFVHVDGNLGTDALRPVETPALSSIYVTVLDNKIQELKETSGNRDYSQGATASGVTAASAIAALQEAGSKLSRDSLKSAYRAFTRECYLCIELMRQFYDAPRTFRIMGSDGSYRFERFDNSRLQPQTEEDVPGVGSAEHLPVFDITVVPAKKSTYSRLSQNELAKDLFGMGIFNPQMADQAAACLEIMDFDGKEKVLERVQQNGTMYQQLQQMQDTVMKMSAVIDSLTGSQMTQNAGQAFALGESAQPGKIDRETMTTDSIGGVQAGDSLAAQARRRAQDQANPAGGAQ